MRLAPCVRPDSPYQLGTGAAPLVTAGVSAAGGPADTWNFGTPVVCAQICCSLTLVPEASLRDTNVALPAPPAAAIAWKAPTASCGKLASTPAGSDFGPTMT